MVEIIQGNNGPEPISSKPNISRHFFPCVRGGKNIYVQNMSNIHVKVNELIQPFFGPLWSNMIQCVWYKKEGHKVGTTIKSEIAV